MVADYSYFYTSVQQGLRGLSPRFGRRWLDGEVGGAVIPTARS